MVALPKDVYLVCRKEGIRPADVAEWRVGQRFPRKDMKGRACWVKPVVVLTKAGKRYVFEVVDLNREGE